MSEIQVASRYAKSLMDLAQEQDIVDSIKEGIKLFVETCRANPKLRAVLKNPIISLDKKVNILDNVFTEKLNPLLLSFFRIVVTKGRSAILYATSKEFMNEYDRRRNIVKARVASASVLSEENKIKMVNVVKKMTNGEVVLIEKVDPTLIGGFVLTVGDKQIDTSVSNQLQKLKKQFDQKVVVA